MIVHTKIDLRSKKYKFKDVSIGMFFIIDSSTYLKISDTHAFNISQCYLGSCAKEMLIDNLIIEIDLTVKKID